MDFVIDFQGRVGLREKGKWWKVIDGHPCFIADESIDSLFEDVRRWVAGLSSSFYDRKSHVGLLRYAVIRCGQSGNGLETMLNIVTSAPANEVEAELVFEKIRNFSAELSDKADYRSLVGK